VTGEFCTIDVKGKRVKNRTIGEMEQEFLEALSAYYYGDTPKLSDEEFTLLKDELLWNGSKVAILDSDEQRFLEASMAYQAGQPILSDEEFDELKAMLKQKSSIVSAQVSRPTFHTVDNLQDVISCQYSTIYQSCSLTGQHRQPPAQHSIYTCHLSNGPAASPLTAAPVASNIAAATPSSSTYPQQQLRLQQQQLPPAAAPTPSSSTYPQQQLRLQQS
jgi:hypothetical protein